MSGTGEKIIRASLKLIAAKGFAATSVRDIAHETNVNVSTLYYYISNKESFLTSIMKYYLEKLISNAEDIIAQVKDSEQQIAAIVQIHVLAHGFNQLPALVIDTEYRALHGENKTLIKNLRKKYEYMWKEIIQSGIDSGKFTGVADAKVATLALLEMCTGVAHWYSSNKKTTLVQISEDYAEMSLNLLGTVYDGKPVSFKDLELPNPINYYKSNWNDLLESKEILLK